MTEVPGSQAAQDQQGHFAAGVAAGVDNGTGTGETQGDFGGEESSESKFLTQEQHERSLKNRLARQERKLREELQKEAEDNARKSRMDEIDRIKVERDEAVNAAKAREAKANERIMLSEAKAQAAALGVPTESLKYISRLVDLADVDIDVDGTPDEEAIVEAVQKVLKDVPALAQRAEVASQESSNGGGTTTSPVMPMGRDRTPDASRSPRPGASAKELFDSRLRNRASRR